MSNKKYDYIVYIGRFQPPHKAHIQTIQMAAEKADNVIVLIGSAVQPRTIKNPWTWQERAQMIMDATDQSDQILTYPVRDRPYNDQQWAAQVQDAVDSAVRMTAGKQDPKIAIIGYSKDESSYYLNLFPQWELIDTGNIDDIHATDIRQTYFESEGDMQQFTEQIGKNLPQPILDYVQAFALQDEYQRLVEEYQHIKRYKQAWESAPYPPTFVTVDAVVIQSGHILLVRRRAQPGKDTKALPGGFINQNESIKEGMVRELREETKLKVPEPVLKGNIVKRDVFDYPGRSLRGRTITHAFLIELPPGELPKVKGSDDAIKAFWIPLSTFWKMEEQLFEDHFHIVDYFIG